MAGEPEALTLFDKGELAVDYSLAPPARTEAMARSDAHFESLEQDRIMRTPAILKSLGQHSLTDFRNEMLGLQTA